MPSSIGRVKPLGATKPLLREKSIDYPYIKGGQALGNVTTWTTGAVCDCFNMQELSLNCCCATCCFPCNSITWGNALQYAGVGSTWRTLSSWAAGTDFGDDSAGRLAKAAAQANQAATGQNARRDLAFALGLRNDMGQEGLLLRCLCGPCIQCQEVDTVFAFYRDSLGYTDIRYGTWYTCSCCRWYATLPQRGQMPPVYGKVPMPESILRGESVGPNYPPSDLPNGYRFEEGEPKQLEKRVGGDRPNPQSFGPSQVK